MNLEGKKLFFLGVGGMGMLPLALFAAEGGARVEGFDDGLTPRAEGILSRAGIVVHEIPPQKHRCDTIIVSSAVKAEHPVLKNLLSGSSPEVVRRGEFLAQVASSRRLLAVVGSHGKTTTTALLAHLAERENWAADFIIGGLPSGDLMPARNRNDEWLIAEIDESDGTIEAFSPEISLFLNFDWDHADRYRNPEEIHKAWARLASRTTGTVIFPQTADLPFELAGDPSHREANFATGNDFLETNSAAAETTYRIATGKEPQASALVGFPGVWRRQTFHARGNDFAVIEDYAHHPQEVGAFLTWLERQGLPQPLRVFFQPHRFSRTTRFVDEFVQALSQLDEVYLHSIYGAGEKPDSTNDPLAAISSGLAARNIRVKHVANLGDFPERRGTFAFVGAGDANEWAPILAAVDKTDSPVSTLAELSDSLQLSGVYRKNENLGRHTTLRIGGTVGLFARPGSVSELRWLIRTAGLLQVPVVFIGNGSNLLVSDHGFEGVVIHLDGLVWERKQISEDRTLLQVGSGVSLPGLARWAAGEGLSGFSFLEGIPGTVGGGLTMNAGSMGGWVGDLTEWVDAIDPNGRLVSFSADQLSFGYRSCPELEGLCIILAVFRIQGTDRPESIRSEMREYSSRRRNSQPGGPSAGCLFRNPEGDSAGRLLDEAGLKGYRTGSVRISDKHANFIQPDPGATAGDVIEIMAYARDRVLSSHGITLEPEVKFLGKHGMRSVFASETKISDDPVR